MRLLPHKIRTPSPLIVSNSLLICLNKGRRSLQAPQIHQDYPAYRALFSTDNNGWPWTAAVRATLLLFLSMAWWTGMGQYMLQLMDERRTDALNPMFSAAKMVFALPFSSTQRDCHMSPTCASLPVWLTDLQVEDCELILYFRIQSTCHFSFPIFHGYSAEFPLTDNRKEGIYPSTKRGNSVWTQYNQRVFRKTSVLVCKVCWHRNDKDSGSSLGNEWVLCIEWNDKYLRSTLW